MFWKIPYVKTYSVEEYFNLPLSERTWKGFYRIPHALPSEMFDTQQKGWGYFYKQIQKEFPVQYFFRYWLWNLDNPLIYLYKRWVSWPFRDTKYAIKNFLKPCYPRWRKVLPRHQYKDLSEIIPESFFALILDFYYEEVLNGIVDWDSHESHKKFKNQLVRYVQWIEKGQLELQEKIDKALTEATQTKIRYKDGKVNYKATYKKNHLLEKKMKDQTDEILHWVVINRDFFWT